MAIHNDGRWITEQIDSILSRNGVEMRAFVSDDDSTDDTLTILENWGVSALEAHTGKRGSVQNFCYIIVVVSAREDGYTAPADQDDIQYPGRLVRQVKILREGPFGAVPSSIDVLRSCFSCISPSPRDRSS